LAAVPRKIAGPATAVAPSSLIISRRRHPVWQELVGLIVWVGEIQDAGGDRAPPVGTAPGSRVGSLNEHLYGKRHHAKNC
jgi:hypothetical protein